MLKEIRKQFETKLQDFNYDLSKELPFVCFDYVYMKYLIAEDIGKVTLRFTNELNNEMFQRLIDYKIEHGELEETDRNISIESYLDKYGIKVKEVINDSIYIDMESSKAYIKLIKQTLKEELHEYLKDTNYAVKTSYSLNWLDGFEIELD